VCLLPAAPREWRQAVGAGRARACGGEAGEGAEGGEEREWREGEWRERRERREQRERGSGRDRE
jgi:hypothetical protein